MTYKDSNPTFNAGNRNIVNYCYRYKKKLIFCEKGINQWLGNINFTWMSGK